MIFSTCIYIINLSKEQMKKDFKVVSLVVALAISGQIYAQNSNSKETQNDKFKVETNRFWSNWFIKVGAGGQVYLGDDDSKASFGKRISPTLDFSVGKWFTPGLGLQLTYSGLSAKGASYMDGVYANGKKNNKGLFEQKWDMMYLHGDILFNVTDMLCGYRENRVYSAIPYLGFGWLHSYDAPRNNEFAANVGFINRFRLSNRWDFNLEARAMMTKDDFDGQLGGKKYEGMVSILAGFTFKFPTSSWKRAEVRTVSTGISMDDMNRIQAELREQQDRSRQLESELATERNKKAEVVVDKQFKVAPRIIIFPLGKSTLSKQERVNLGYYAKLIKEAPTDKVFTIVGYADNKTGSSSVNERLSKERAEAVRNALIDEFGVNPSRLKVDYKGGVDNMYYDDATLSRAVIVD